MGEVVQTSSRQRSFFNLGALAAAMLLIVAGAAFDRVALRGVRLGIGIAACAMSLALVGLLMHQRRLAGDPELWVFGHLLGLFAILAGAMASVAIWEVVGAAGFAPDVSRWLTSANGMVIAALACAGLVAREICTERVVHAREVVEQAPLDGT